MRGKRASRRSSRIRLSDARVRLISLWVAAVSVASLILVAESMSGTKIRPEDVKGVWEWFASTSAPTFSMILGVWVANATSREDMRTINKDVYRVAFWLSVVYLTLLLVTILGEPFRTTDTSERPESALQFFKRSTYWLTPFQAFCGTSLGALFAGKQHANKTDRSDDD